MNFEELKNLIIASIPDAEVEITDLTGTQDHLGIHVTSQAFENKPLLQQHRLVMDILKAPLKEQIHAVKIKTQVPRRNI